MDSSRRTQALLRLLFTLILAAGLHLALFSTLSLDPVISPPSGNTLQLTLTAQPPEPEPEQQTALDTLAIPPAATAEATKPTVQTPARETPAAPKAVPAKPQIVEKPKAPAAISRTPAQEAKSATKPAATKKTPEKSVQSQTVVATEPEKPPKVSTGSLIARSLTLARSDNLTDFGAAPVGRRTKRLVAGKKASLEENSYLRHWREKVQRIGARNYPESARNEKLSGSLRLLVTLRSDGSLEETVILISSGNSELDAAAIRIVKLAAPFRPFPVEMKKKIDRLEIVRTWKFENNTVVY